MVRKLLNYAKMRRAGLRSLPLRERMYPVTVGGETLSVQHSKFNLDWLEQLGVDPAVIVELGAFDGGDAHRFKARFPQARVVTVEADPDRIRAVRRTLADSDVEVFNFAACDRDGPIDWFAAEVDGAPNAQGSVFRHTQAYRERFPFVSQAEAPVQVEGRRFDSFCREAGIAAIDLLHMDIEGAEIMVLRSLGDVRPGLIYMEWREGFFEGHEDSASAGALLAGAGYELLADLGEDRLYRYRGG